MCYILTYVVLLCIPIIHTQVRICAGNLTANTNQTSDTTHKHMQQLPNIACVQLFWRYVFALSLIAHTHTHTHMHVRVDLNVHVCIVRANTCEVCKVHRRQCAPVWERECEVND